ncbi:uncharacterized protein LOC125052688 isoform X1 [Pieris napi]|uniref:uncharacterized protein LOC125052688 isoform X1 n=1 Tax=Pieris napi TaxID=78633 RepID=UPI001FB93F1A|nr:uncharacterized protein LOC125052688 isoform X1 [Pieris napi]
MSNNCVVVSGLPKNVKRQKMVHFLRSYVFKKPPLQFWIESMSSGSNNSKDMLIRFETEAAADFAARTLQDYPYQHTDQDIYKLKCWIKNNPDNTSDPQEFAEDVKIERDVMPVEFQRPYSPVRERDRSPHLREELTKLELEIELTNKKRMLLEAERNLLLEQKRLEMLQKSGTPDLPVEDSTQSSTSSALLTVPPKKRERKRPQDQTPHSREPSKNLYWPSKILMKDMLHCVRRNVNPDQIPLFNALLRNVVRKRLTDILGDEPNQNTKKCISMYRMLYPRDVDEDFVITLKNLMLQGQLPPELQGPCLQSGTSNVNITNTSNNIDPADLPISELSKDLDDWTEDTTASDT